MYNGDLSSVLLVSFETTEIRVFSTLAANRNRIGDAQKPENVMHQCWALMCDFSDKLSICLAVHEITCTAARLAFPVVCNDRH